MDILGLGAISVDDFLELDAHPVPDSKRPVRDRRREGGGLCATALVAAARLGASAAFVGVLGDEELSRFSLDALEREGVDCSRVLRRDGARPRQSTILIDRSDGGRCVLSERDGVVPFPPDEFRAEWLDEARVLFVDHTDAHAGTMASKFARERGVAVVADVERADEDAIETLMAQVDHLIVSLDFARQLTGETSPARALRALSDGGYCDDPVLLCVTDGARGSLALWDDAMSHVPAFAVEAVDTTGCGDAFHGAYAAEVARGTGIGAALRFASAVAALKATQPGGRSGLPSRDKVEAFLRERTE